MHEGTARLASFLLNPPLARKAFSERKEAESHQIQSHRIQSNNYGTCTGRSISWPPDPIKKLLKGCQVT